jgi:hypothetical protein
MAARGLRVTDDGVEKVANPQDRAETWRVGRQVLVGAAMTALLATLFVVLIPTS